MKKAEKEPFQIEGHCDKCKAPLFLNHCSDWYGNSILSLHCWNGHYKWIEIQDIEKNLHIDPETNVVTYIGFFDVS